MRQWNKETIEEQLKLHKKQNKDVRYNYICEQFNPIWYCWELEKYTLHIDKEIERLNNIINELETWINNVKTFDDICVYEDYSGRWGIQPEYILDKLKELKESEK